MQRAGKSQADLAREIGVPSSTVSRWRVQAPQPDNLRRIAEVLDIPVLELFVQAGYLTKEEADIHEVHVQSSSGPVGIEAAIAADDHLLPEAKVHFLNQYRLLLRVADDVSSPADRTDADDGPGLRAVARRRRGPSGRRGS